jgi:hypothetical protein
MQRLPCRSFVGLRVTLGAADDNFYAGAREKVTPQAFGSQPNRVVLTRLAPGETDDV